MVQRPFGPAAPYAGERRELRRQPLTDFCVDCGAGGQLRRCKRGCEDAPARCHEHLYQHFWDAHPMSVPPCTHCGARLSIDQFATADESRLRVAIWRCEKCQCLFLLDAVWRQLAECVGDKGLEARQGCPAS